jgi:Apea-like HEPN
MSEPDQIRTSLADLFIKFSTTIVQRFQLLEVPLTVPVSHLAVTRHDSGWGTSSRTEDVNILNDEMSLIRSSPLVGFAETRSLFECATSLAREFSETLPFAAPNARMPSPLIESVESAYSPIAMPDYEESPESWVVHAIVVPAMKWHLASLPNLATAEQRTARAFADSVIRVASDKKNWSCALLPLSGIDVSSVEGGVATVGNVAIRQLTEQQMSRWLMESRSLLSPLVTPPEVLLEIRSSRPRHVSKSTDFHGLAESVLTSFQLHGYSLAGGMFYVQEDPQWLGGRIGTTINLPQVTGGSLLLDHDGLRRIVATSKQIARFTRRTSHSPGKLALERFASGVARRDPDDALVDFTVALEALLLPYDDETKHGELSYRFRMHGAHYLAASGAERTKVASELRDIYNFRSRIVHGGRYPEFEKLVASWGAARTLVAKGLLRALSEGFPTSGDFNKMILGGT